MKEVDPSPEEEGVYVTAEVLTVSVPAKVKLTGVAPPDFAAEPEVFNAFVDLMKKSLSSIMEPPEGADIVITAINGVPVSSNRRLDDASEGEPETLVIDFDIVMVVNCDGECDDATVAAELMSDLEGANKKLEEATSSSSSAFADVLAENAAMDPILASMADDFADITAVPYVAPTAESIQSAVTDAPATQTMSDGSTNTLDSDIGAASTLSFSLAVWGTVVAIFATLL